MTFIRTSTAVSVLLAAILVSRASADQDALARAKALYTSAAYDEALALLDEVGNGEGAGTENVEVDQYRAFCLLALGRNDDARKVIQQIVEANPTFQPSDAQMSPRLQEAFRDVRRRLLPSIVRQSYAAAKAAFERKEFDTAGKGFESVVTLLGDRDAAGAANLGDLKILSQGFLDLIKTMPAVAAPPAAAPAPAAAAPTTTAAPPTQTAVPATTAPDAPRPAPLVYDAGDTDITPPVAISQVMPPWHPDKRLPQTYEGTLIVVIDEQGNVTSITSQGSLHPQYLQVLRRAASQWKFRPATKNGVPVTYRKVVSIRLSPSG